MSEIIQAFFPLLLATLIAIWIYRLFLKHKEAKEKEFEALTAEEINTIEEQYKLIFLS